MGELLGVYPLWDRRTGNEVEASLWQFLEDRHVQDFVQRWKPIFDSRLAELSSQAPLTAAIVAEHNLHRPCGNSAPHSALPIFRGLRPRGAGKNVKIGSLRDRTEPCIEFSHGLFRMRTGSGRKRLSRDETV